MKTLEVERDRYCGCCGQAWDAPGSPGVRGPQCSCTSLLIKQGSCHRKDCHKCSVHCRCAEGFQDQASFEKEVVAPLREEIKAEVQPVLVETSPKHKCMARRCKAQIPLNILMCYPHWRALPRQMKADVSDNYRRGQEIDHQTTGPYRLAVVKAMDWTEQDERSRNVFPAQVE